MDDIKPKTQTNEDKRQQDAEVTEWKDKYIRALADYQNVTKRASEQVADARIYAGEHIVQKLLPIVDSLSKAKEHLKDPGLDIVHKEFMAILEELGVEKIDVIKKEFDPHIMECIDIAEGKENMVLEEMESGYTLHGKLLRAAKVKVGKKGG